MAFYKPSFIYTTQRVVKVKSKCLSLTHTLIAVFILLYIGLFGIWIKKRYQETTDIQSAVVTSVKGVVNTKFTNIESEVPNPELYRRVWDANDIALFARGDDSGGFVILTNLIVTSNQKRGVCPENYKVENALCKIDKECPVDEVLNIGNGPMTGKCIKAIGNNKTCEVSAWCPVAQDTLPLGTGRALLVDVRNFTVLVKNSIEFPGFGDSYKRRNIQDSATHEYLKTCIFNPVTAQYCPTFRIEDIVTLSGQKFENVAITGGVFAIKILWDCSFDFGASIKNCRPQYSFTRLDNPDAFVAPGYSFWTTVYHEENRRTLTKNYGLKIIVEVEGIGRRFNLVTLVLAIGAGMGLLAIATKFCDFLLKLFCKLKRRFNWSWLDNYSETMKCDLTHVKCSKPKPTNEQDCVPSQELI